MSISCILYSASLHRSLHSFPTRRSSDLHDADVEDWRALLLLLARAPEDLMAAGGISQAWTQSGRAHFVIREIDYRSEEHTSELQSLRHLVCRLLLEKKKRASTRRRRCRR